MATIFFIRFSFAHILNGFSQRRFITRKHYPVIRWRDGTFLHFVCLGILFLFQLNVHRLQVLPFQNNINLCANHFIPSYVKTYPLKRKILLTFDMLAASSMGWNSWLLFFYLNDSQSVTLEISVLLTLEAQNESNDDNLEKKNSIACILCRRSRLCQWLLHNNPSI